MGFSDDRFGELRSIAHGPFESGAWARLLSMLGHVDEAFLRDGALTYLERAISDWPAERRGLPGNLRREFRLGVSPLRFSLLRVLRIHRRSLYGQRGTKHNAWVEHANVLVGLHTLRLLHTEVDGDDALALFGDEGPRPSLRTLSLRQQTPTNLDVLFAKPFPNLTTLDLDLGEERTPLHALQNATPALRHLNLNHLTLEEDEARSLATSPWWPHLQSLCLKQYHRTRQPLNILLEALSHTHTITVRILGGVSSDLTRLRVRHPNLTFHF